MSPGDRTPRDPVPGAAGPGDPLPRYPVPGDLARRARAWIADDPSLADRAELQDLLDAARRDDPAGRAAAADLADRFAGRLEFGTAGLRGAMGAGPNRMNRAVVRAATAGLARWLREYRPDAAGSRGGARLGRPAPLGGVRRGSRGRADRGGHPGAPAARPQPHARCSPSRSGTCPPGPA